MIDKLILCFFRYFKIICKYCARKASLTSDRESQLLIFIFSPNLLPHSWHCSQTFNVQGKLSSSVVPCSRTCQRNVNPPTNQRRPHPSGCQNCSNDPLSGSLILSCSKTRQSFKNHRQKDKIITKSNGDEQKLVYSWVDRKQIPVKIWTFSFHREKVCALIVCRVWDNQSPREDAAKPLRNVAAER